MSVPLDSVGKLVPGFSGQVEGKGIAPTSAPDDADGKFGDLFSDLINSVNELHHDSARLQEAFLAGEPVELHQVMIKAEEAGLATELLLEIRNRIVNACNELLRMPI
ncbi:MAG: flagellar hook-basal body complex protein FliE [Candidatus Zixiibacteriota bacterium]